MPEEWARLHLDLGEPCGPSPEFGQPHCPSALPSNLAEGGSLGLITAYANPMAEELPYASVVRSGTEARALRSGEEGTMGHLWPWGAGFQGGEQAPQSGALGDFLGEVASEDRIVF